MELDFIVERWAVTIWHRAITRISQVQFQQALPPYSSEHLEPTPGKKLISNYLDVNIFSIIIHWIIEGALCSRNSLTDFSCLNNLTKATLFISTTDLTN